MESFRRTRSRPKLIAESLTGRTVVVRLVLFGFFLTVALIGTLTFQLLPSRYALNEGDVSPFDIKSPTKFSYVSQVKTNQDRQRASVAIPDVYQTLADAGAEAQVAAATAINQITQIRKDPSPDSERIVKLTALTGITITPSLAAEILDLSDTQWRDSVTAILRVVDRTMRTRITPLQLTDVRSSIPTQIDPGLDDREAVVVIPLSRGFIRATDVVDQTATNDARRQAAESVQPTRLTVGKGETILRNGDVTTVDDLEKLEAAGLRNPSIDWTQVLAMTLAALAASGFMCAFIFRFRPAIAGNPRRLLLLGALIVAPLIVAKLTVPGRELYSYLFPIAATPMLLAMLLDAELSVVVTAVQAALFGLVLNNSLEPVCATLIAGGLGAVWVHRLERLNRIWAAAAVVSVANFAVIVSFHLAASDLDFQTLILYAFLALVSGALSGALTLGMVSVLGHLFGIATTMNLLELAHPSQPLFRRLLNEAPGTYHHSVVVANLAERAAAAIGADTLLVRIGGYYHDIGKLMRPYAFIENQIDEVNVHDQLDPLMSARIILDHVTDGLDLGERHGIPVRVRDMIGQHHGTMTVQYFLWKASQSRGEPVDESLFRYAGPKPQSREAGIMMLADGVEATVRANRDHSAENVTAIIDRIVQERINGGQLDECDLTLADIRKIKVSFLSVLQGIFHPRVEYPLEVTRAIASVGGVR